MLWARPSHPAMARVRCIVPRLRSAWNAALAGGTLASRLKCNWDVWQTNTPRKKVTVAASRELVWHARRREAVVLLKADLASAASKATSA